MNNVRQKSHSLLISIVLVFIFLVTSSQHSMGTGTTVSFKNSKYGFSVALPSDWKGYSVVATKWRGYNSASVHAVTSGPLISLRSSMWTARKPRQDIPVMILTSHQWQALNAEKFHIGAAPILPSLLARNSRFVFALPARYNFAYLPGYSEVEKIIAAHSVTAFESFYSNKL